ncbi:MAG: hypothetical protein R2883_08520 [Caldisericia bacterium]
MSLQKFVLHHHASRSCPELKSSPKSDRVICFLVLQEHAKNTLVAVPLDLNEDATIRIRSKTVKAREPM